MATITLRAPTKRALLEAARDFQAESVDDLLVELMISYRRTKLREVSNQMRSRMRKKGLRRADLMK